MSAGGYGPAPKLCTCGKVVTGNGARASHRRVCDGSYYSDSQAYQMRAYSAEAARCSAGPIPSDEGGAA